MTDLGLDDESADAAWGRAMQTIRDHGEDPDKVLDAAVENIRLWHAAGRDPLARLSPDELAEVPDISEQEAEAILAKFEAMLSASSR